LERTIEGGERKSHTFGLRGVERRRAQQRAHQELARRAGAAADQIDRIGAAYDRMAVRAEAGERRARIAAERTAAERQRAADTARLGTGLSTLAGGAGRIAAAAGVTFGLSEVFSIGREAIAEQARIEQL